MHSASLHHLFRFHHSDQIIPSSLLLVLLSQFKSRDHSQLSLSGRSEATRLFHLNSLLSSSESLIRPPLCLRPLNRLLEALHSSPRRYIQVEYIFDYRVNFSTTSNNTAVKMPSLRAFVLGLAFTLLALIQLSAATPVPAVAAAGCTTLPSKVAATTTPALPLSGGTYLSTPHLLPIPYP
jgi:hypothetical protein